MPLSHDYTDYVTSDIVAGHTHTHTHMHTLTFLLLSKKKGGSCVCVCVCVCVSLLYLTTPYHKLVYIFVRIVMWR